MQSDVVIVGGGLAGLACAVALRDCGLRIRVFEGSARLGGRACSWTDPHTCDDVDLGPHILLTEYRNMLAFLEQLGTRDRIVWETERLLRLREGRRVTDMRLHALPPPLHLLPSLATTKSVSLADVASNRRVLWMAMRATEEHIKHLDGRSALDLLRHSGVSDRFIEWFWATACMSVLNVPLDRCSAGALMRVFAQLTGLQEYAIGFADEALANLFVPGSIRMLERAGGRVYTESRVDRIVGEQGRFHSVMLQGGERIEARFCVAAVPPQCLTRLLPDEWAAMDPFKDVGRFEPSPYVSSYLWLDRKVTDERFWARIWNPCDLNTDFYDLSNIRRGWSERRESVIASNIIFSHRADGLSDEQIVAATLDDIREALPAAEHAHIRHAVVNRIPMAISCPTPGCERCRPATRTPIEGLLLAGDWTDTGLPSSMESAVHSGWAAAEVILQMQGRPHHLVLPKRELEGIAGWVRRYGAR
ncbi:FAD-dependent oxidoreductase [Steroidobacter sp. S1-65]|uniref:FAD-dependent oxidoreductase n=1 Tax=Steroidobacter gossypii TaxID=2805490 RepID=A0ABS1WQU9_9GAMM|nr:hydroxysqualene dehydroxylase HpnE [Steroidobacter gossypii]MBM0103352.1 FAD-dependent oxidoreductase [Steroidobacter gossypii]